MIPMHAAKEGKHGQAPIALQSEQLESMHIFECLSMGDCEKQAASARLNLQSS